jgi:hypothetical protein
MTKISIGIINPSYEDQSPNILFWPYHLFTLAINGNQNVSPKLKIWSCPKASKISSNRGMAYFVWMSSLIYQMEIPTHVAFFPMVKNIIFG